MNISNIHNVIYTRTKQNSFSNKNTFFMEELSDFDFLKNYHSVAHTHNDTLIQTSQQLRNDKRNLSHIHRRTEYSVIWQ